MDRSTNDGRRPPEVEAEAPPSGRARNAVGGAVPLYPGERVDRLGLGRRVIIQREDVFRFGIDAVLLAAFARVPGGGRVADLGAGTGAVALLLADRTAAHFMLVDVQPEVLDMARRSAVLNGFAERMAFVVDDVKNLARHPEAGRFDYVTCNPPYVARCSEPPGRNRARYVARHETTATIDDFARAAGALLKPKGRSAWIYRPERLADLFAALGRARLEPKRMRFVHPRQGAKAVLVLIEAVRLGGVGLTVEAPLYIYDGDAYSAEMRRIYAESGEAQ
ncbi:MAG: tRNA1(Val) (adenine(37)-N6)-methyltransferase [Hydrogenibacillus sp.]|nr:tRNA1(Val) (adenine(37)-N6)-methyltransferase [Hydrogenibacillus sp.]